MVFGIIAAGEGSRLAKEGFTLPKPLVPLQGESLIERLVRIFMDERAESIYVVINKHSPKLERVLRKLKVHAPIQIVKKDTVSSLHSLCELLDAFPHITELCLTTTDTVFAEMEFHNLIEDFQSDKSVDALMGVTSFVDDESPLYVRVNANREILGFSDQSKSYYAHVSGGIYCLRSKALSTAQLAISKKMERMRNFQRLLLEQGLHVKAHPFSQIVDIDHVKDIKVAEAFLNKLNRASIANKI
ncbi:sugar phosphate nucleotidyltransferase [Olivibacter sitiensis]|uniref:sugar phosphate nucleotidyltransferase n=1 Tax=Olivibacter sitiensis TaxID=376470 RepID=UPI0003FE6763|nr:NTP transferase domain-containing protein [Olivibacter sitiensis]